jgi:dihydrofolate reductase
VTTGIQDALEQARAGAGTGTGTGDKDVVIGGGADVARQYLRAGLVDEFQLHLVPVFLAPAPCQRPGDSPWPDKYCSWSVASSRV